MMFLRKKLLNKIKGFFCWIYVRFLYILSKNHVYLPIFSIVLVHGYFLYSTSGYHFMLYSSVTYSFLVYLLTRPFFYLSVYPSEQQNYKDYMLNFIKTYGTFDDLYYYKKTKKVYLLEYSENYKCLSLKKRFFSFFRHPNVGLFRKALLFFNIIGFLIDFPVIFPLFTCVAYPSTHGIFILTPNIFLSTIENLPEYEEFNLVNIKDISLKDLLEKYIGKNSMLEEIPLKTEELTKKESFQTKIKSYINFLQEHIKSHHGFADPELLGESDYDADEHAAQEELKERFIIEEEYKNYIDKRENCALAAEYRRDKSS